MLNFLRSLGRFNNRYKSEREVKFQLSFNKAIKLSEWKMYDVSIPLYKKALEILPDNDAAHFKIAEDYRENNDIDNAIIHYQKCLDLNPNDPYGASLKLYILGMSENFGGMPQHYITNLFDQYAPHFDTNLVDRLGYNAPELAFDLVSTINKSPKMILDLGCGTGLSAEKFSNAVIHGVDLSSGMLKQARQKGIYDRLFEQDIHSYLTACDNQYDLVLALDLFIYVGDIEDLFEKISEILNENGLFVFTIQTVDTYFDLTADHRYSHSHEYITQNLQKNNLKILECQNINLREGETEAVKGAIYVCQFSK